MSTWDKTSEYYSGQGVLMLGTYDKDGEVEGLIPIGNVPELTTTIETSSLEHKESQSGQRGTDLRLSTEIKSGIEYVLEDFSAENLQKALRAEILQIPKGSVADAPVNLYAGRISARGHLSLSNVALKVGTDTLTPYTDEKTPYDYMVNSSAGSIRLNDGTQVNTDKLGVKITDITVGATTTVTASNTFKEGDRVTILGLEGTHADMLNGIEFMVQAPDASKFTLAIDTTSKVITTGAGSKALFMGKIEATISYNYEAQLEIHALTKGSEYYFLRFEGLNTADNNKPVVIDVWRFQSDPINQLSLISDEVQSMSISGSVLADSEKEVGSKYFVVRKLA